MQRTSEQTAPRGGRFFAPIRALVALVLTSLVTIAGQASATNRPSNEIRVNLRGSIPVACEFGAATGTVSFGQQLTAGATRSIEFGVNCNVPYVILTRSQNGGLVTGSKSAGPGIINQIPYELSFSIPTTGGAAAMERCSSIELRDGNRRSCSRVSSGDGVSLEQKTSLEIMLAGDRSSVPVAGFYQDTIIMQIVPQV